MTENRRALALALLAAGAAIAAVFLVRFGPARLLLSETVPPAAVATVVLLSCYACGRVATRDLADALLIGFPTFGTVIAAIAWIGVALDVTVLLATGVAAVIGAILLLRTRPAIPRVPAVLWIPIAFALTSAILPVASPDELIYKLAVPQTYRLFGGMVELPLNSNSYITLAPHFTDLAALIASGGVAAKLARFGIFLAALAALTRVGGTWLAAAVAWTPALLIIAGWCWDEWVVIGLLAVSIHRWMESRSPVAFMALGAAIACKYTALPWLAAFAVVVLIRDRRLALRGALLVIAFGGFFYLRNAVWTGNPLAPLFEANAPRVMGYRTGQDLTGFEELLHGADIFDPDIVDESLGILLPLAAFASLFALRRRDLRDVLVAGAVQLPILLLIAPGSRNLVNGFVALAIPGAIVAHEIIAGAGLVIRRLAAVLAGIAMTGHLVLVTFVFESYSPLRYLAGRERAHEFIARDHDFMKPFAFIESSTAPSARVLFLGEIQPYYLDRQALAGGNLDGPRIAAWLSRFTTTDALRAEWRRMGISHVLLRRSRFVAGTGRAQTMLEREYMHVVPPRVHAVVIETLKTRAVLRYRDADYLVFELR